LASENDAIDYALMERSDNLQVIPASFDWRDVGNFNDVHEANALDEKNNYESGDNIYSVEVENSYIRNEENDKPIAIIGLSNVVVVNTKDGILVARKDVSHKVGDIAKKVQA
jgi:mannose-1-phosphate guanylyltransferase